MRRKLAMLIGPIPCLILLMGLTPTLEAPLVARASVPKPPMKVWYGKASWYGPTFQGRTTADGELYDMTAFTAAHMTLPFGAIVRLINTRNGKSAVVRINDRGPFVEDREIDVSYKAAEKLGLINRGVSKLRIELLEVPKRP